MLHLRPTRQPEHVEYQHANMNSKRFTLWPAGNEAVFPVLGALRIIILIGVILRFSLHPEAQNQTPFILPTQVLVQLFVVLYIACGMLGMVCYYVKYRRAFAKNILQRERGGEPVQGRWLIWFTVWTDCAFFTGIYALTMEPESDFFLFYFVTLVTAIMFLAGRDALKVLGLVTGSLLLALLLILLRWGHHSPEFPRQFTVSRLALNIFILRAMAFGCACLPLGLLISMTRRLNESDAKLRESEELYTSLVRTIPEFIFRKDREKRFTYASAGFYRFLGVKEEDVIGKDDYSFFAKELADQYRADDDLVLSGREILRKEEENRLQDGKSGSKTRTVSVTKVPVRDAKGSIVGIQASFLDITEVKKAKHKMLRWFVHDTPKPLVIIRDKHIHTLREAAEAIPQTDVRQKVERASERISTLIEFALACFDAYGFLSDTDKYSWKFGDQDGGTFNLHEVVDIVLFCVRTNDEEIRFLKDIPANLRVQSDRYKVIALIYLLVDNATWAFEKMRKPRMEITIGLKVIEDQFEIRIVDNGCGMTEEQKNKAFIEGESGRGSSGLGLAIVKGFSLLAGGTADIQSVVNEGTTVVVRIKKFRIVK